LHGVAHLSTAGVTPGRRKSKPGFAHNGGFPCKARVLRNASIREGPNKQDAKHSRYLTKGKIIEALEQTTNEEGLQVVLVGFESEGMRVEGWVKIKTKGVAGFRSEVLSLFSE
jgi:hypothetical protein